MIHCLAEDLETNINFTYYKPLAFGKIQIFIFEKGSYFTSGDA